MDVPTLLAEHGVKTVTGGTHHHVRHGWVGTDCPFCSPHSGRFRLGYPLGGRVFVCWSCGRHPIRKVLFQLLGDGPGVRKGIAELDFPVHAAEQNLKQLNGKVVLPKGVENLTQPHIDYLKRRGFDPYLLNRFWGVEGIGKKSTKPWRLFIPIHLNGEVVSWTTRTLCDDGQRYHSAKPSEEKYHHKELLYGEDFVPGDRLVVLEGPFDVYRVGAGSVGTFGTSWTKSQLERIARYPVRHVCYDNSPDAQRSARELCRSLSCFPGETHNVQIDSKDPGSATDDEVAQLRALIVV